ncbi:MAG: hypothetical protein ACE5D7_02630, partial [Fidelibacterota bacterium]
MNITLLIFSYNRAMQLDAVLRSLLRHCQDVSHAGVHVLYKADDRHMGSYQQLRRDYSQYSWIHFIKENTFHQDLIQCMDDSENILFLVDDNLFTRDFKLHHYVEALQSRERVIGVSLRLGRNTTYCYPLDQKQSIPIFTPLIQGDLFFYSWSGCDHDYGYPLEVSSSIYRVTDIQTILGQNPVQNPNHFETLLSEHANQIKDRYPELICPRQSITFCIPVNKVQSVIKENRAGEKYAYSSDELLE